MDSFRDVIGQWSSQRAFAEAVGADFENARKWAQRNSIPPEWWGAVVSASKEFDLPISLEALQSISRHRLREAS